MRDSYSGSTLASQAECASSILVSRFLGVFLWLGLCKLTNATWLRYDGRMKQSIAHTLKQSICDTHDRYLCDCHGQTAENAKALADFFTRLDAATDTNDDDIAQEVLNDKRIREIEQGLRAHTSKAEYALELYWAQHIASSTHPKETLEGFPFYAQYRDMLRSNYHALRMCTDAPIMRVLCVGSGPLPLSALLLKQEFGIEVECVDYDPVACTASRALFNAFADTEKIPVHACNVLNLHDLKQFDAVILAALVGENSADKQTVIRHLHKVMRPKALLLARAANHLKTLCYPKMDAQDMPGFDVLAHIHHPANAGINAVLVGANTAC